jgi:hypothetical protein
MAMTFSKPVLISKQRGAIRCLLFIVWTQVFWVVLKYVGRPSKEATVSEYLQSDGV